MAYKTLLVEESDGVLLVTLNRPEVHNAFNDELIGEAVEVFRGVGQRNVRAVVLRGSGSNFCAGADLNWMSGMLNYSRDENVRDSSNLARMYACIRARRSAAVSGWWRSAILRSAPAIRNLVWQK